MTATSGQDGQSGRAEAASSKIRTAFSSSDPALTALYARALAELAASTLPSPSGESMLIEGGDYQGAWLESTGSISAEILSRFDPELAGRTFSLFARHQRDDGLIPYKILPTGASWRQIQMVTPLARSVWRHYRLTGKNRSFLATMYAAMVRNDAWLARWRDTRKTGCVEAFCTFDTGHDLSPRFWHMPDTCHREDPTRFDPDSPLLPLLAPDLTANVACQRRYLAKMAKELGDPEAAQGWEAAAASTEAALYRHCFHAQDGFFYDLDSANRPVAVQSDVLLRVLACGIGDGAFFETSLRRYLLNTRKFFSHYPFTSIALDDPRFFPSSRHNSWAGTSTFLSLARAPAAFDIHGRQVELSWIIRATLTAAARFTRFPQCLDPWTGEEGYTDHYSPAMLCILDSIERHCGILPRPDGSIWFTALPWPTPAGKNPGWTRYSRSIDGTEFCLECDGIEACIRSGSQILARFSAGSRLIMDREARIRSIVGMSPRVLEARIEDRGRSTRLALGANEEYSLSPDGPVRLRTPGLVLPVFG